MVIKEHNIAHSEKSNSEEPDRYLSYLGDDILTLCMFGVGENLPMNIHKYHLLFFLTDRLFSLQWDFIPTTDGPFCTNIAADIKILLAKKVVHKSKNTYTLTEKGHRLYYETGLDQSGIVYSALADFKEFVSGMNKNELLVYIYTDHPGYILKSDELDCALAHRADHAKNLFYKGLVSRSKAAALTGQSLEYFIEYTKQKH